MKINATKKENLIKTLAHYPMAYHIWKKGDFTSKDPHKRDYKEEHDKNELKEALIFKMKEALLKLKHKQIKKSKKSP